MSSKLKSRLALSYALAALYLLYGILVVVLAFSIPGLTTTSEAAFCLLGILIFVTALIHVSSISALVKGPEGESGS